MEYYEKSILVQQEDLDDLKHVNNIRYIEWIQEISKEHWESRVSEELRKELIWVVISHHVQYKNEARLGDTVQVKTFIADTRGAISIRAVEMRLAGSEKILVTSETEWCLLNARTSKPMRISEEIRSFFDGSSNFTP